MLFSFILRVSKGQRRLLNFMAIIFVITQNKELLFDRGAASDLSNGADMIDEPECLWSIYDERGSCTS